MVLLGGYSVVVHRYRYKRPGSGTIFGPLDILADRRASRKLVPDPFARASPKKAGVGT